MRKPEIRISNQRGARDYRTPSRVSKSDRFETTAQSDNAGRLVKYRVHEGGKSLRFEDVLRLWESDAAFVDFYLSLFPQCGYKGYVWETPAICSGTLQRQFEFVVHSAPKAFSRPDRETFQSYFNTEEAPDGIVAFENLGRDALLIVPSPYRKDADYTGLCEFLREAPLSQQRALWQELSRHARSRVSDRPMWMSVAGGGVAWLHLRLDSIPKYYRYEPYTS